MQSVNQAEQSLPTLTLDGEQIRFHAWRDGL